MVGEKAEAVVEAVCHTSFMLPAGGIVQPCG